MNIRIESTGTDAVVHRAVLASLPNRYQVVDGPAEVVFVSAADISTTVRACRSGAQVVVLDRPGRLSADEVAKLLDIADSYDCFVVPAPHFAPRLYAVSGHRANGGYDLLESAITVSDGFRSGMVEQLALVRSVLGEVKNMQVLLSSDSYSVVEATTATGKPTPILLTSFVSPVGAETLDLQAIGPAQRLSVHIDAGPLARPARIARFDSSGGHSPPLLHQHAHRITLERLHDALTGGSGDIPYTHIELLADLRTASSLPVE